MEILKVDNNNNPIEWIDENGVYTYIPTACNSCDKTCINCKA